MFEQDIKELSDKELLRLEHNLRDKIDTASQNTGIEISETYFRVQVELEKRRVRREITAAIGQPE